MQRKYIYVLVVFLTIALVIAESFYSEAKEKEAEMQLSEQYQEKDDLINKIEADKHSLVIMNYQDDDKEIKYVYQLKIDDIAGAFKYSYNGEDKYMVFTANGEAKVYIKSNESITIYDLPEGTHYYIEQLNVIKDEYTTTVGEEEKTIIEGNIKKENIIEFTNKKIVIEEQPEEKPEVVPDNPYTAAEEIIRMVLLFIIAAILIFTYKNYKIKRFE